MNFIETNWGHLFINRFGRRRFAVGSGVPEGTSEPSGLLQHNRNGRRMRRHRKSAPRNHLDQSRRQRRQRRTRSPTGKNSESHRRDLSTKLTKSIGQTGADVGQFGVPAVPCRGLQTRSSRADLPMCGPQLGRIHRLTRHSRPSR